MLRRYHHVAKEAPHLHCNGRASATRNKQPRLAELQSSPLLLKQQSDPIHPDKLPVACSQQLGCRPCRLHDNMHGNAIARQYARVCREGEHSMPRRTRVHLECRMCSCCVAWGSCRTRHRQRQARNQTTPRRASGVAASLRTEHHRGEHSGRGSDTADRAQAMTIVQHNNAAAGLLRCLISNLRPISVLSALF